MHLHNLLHYDVAENSSQRGVVGSVLKPQLSTVGEVTGELQGAVAAQGFYGHGLLLVAYLRIFLLLGRDFYT